ncbi:MAG TPA: RsmB/NOP family class I SAM-dependent RNA methyltransferase [Verrucomicrobiae bacterium]|nr:RsmB/NOP family class I SAM-dependent RNA methyltransferase [Verrucomicrobiae bacterium]
MSSFPTLTIAGQILSKASREHPADEVLRHELKNRGGISRAEAGPISHAVFAYYRWRGWLDASQAIEAQLQSALGLADRFKKQPQSFSDAELVARAVPAWVKEEMEVSAEWARALQAEPKLWLRARPGQGRALGRALGDCRAFGAGALADALEYLGRKDLFRTKEFHTGAFEVQDLSSQAVGLVCTPQPGQMWWDACAGEGGKALHLADLMQNQGLIWASDRAEWRLKILKRRAARARVFNYRSTLWDGAVRLPTRTRFDGVLVDAPCSGIGTWQRNPQSRWTTDQKDVRELGGVQLQLLVRAAEAVKPGGKLIYAVCTLAAAETLSVAAAFQEQCPEFKPTLMNNPLVPGSATSTQLWLRPQDFGGNGMFVAAWSTPKVHARTCDVQP